MAYEIPSDPTAIPFTEYAALNIEAKTALVDAVYEQYKTKLTSMLGHSAAWVLVCGPECEIVQTAPSVGEALTDDEIWEEAAQIGYAPFHFFEEEIIEDIAAA